MAFDLDSALKDAVTFGITVGIVAAALLLIWAFGHQLAAPKVTVAAAMPKPGFGFQLPD